VGHAEAGVLALIVAKITVMIPSIVMLRMICS
jgi:hypothetical protein